MASPRHPVVDHADNDPEATTGAWLGLIAGNGRFPRLFAENARRLGYRVSAVALLGETDPVLEEHVDRIHWISIGHLGKLIKAFKQDGVRQAVMVGGVKKTHLFAIRPDFRALTLLRRMNGRKDDMLLRALASELEAEGIRIRESTFGLKGLLVEEGVLTRRSPTKSERRDIDFGWEIAQAVGKLDIGQCVVVKDRVVVAIEAVEGTDEAIRRGGALANGGAVVVKRFKPQQDRRFDLPTVGPMTIEVMAKSGASVLAVEAGHALFLDRAEAIAAADKAGIAVLGVASSNAKP
ncbi:MAG TPA: UDP-2,3-diacylglucosamine diphosphatase LpxI [Nitrospirales bacterium]